MSVRNATSCGSRMMLLGSEFMTQNWSMARKCALDVFCSFCFSSNCPSTNCDSCKTRIKRRRQRRAGVGHVADQRQRDGIAVHVRPSTRHTVPQFAHEQRGLICREEAVGVVVVEAEYAFDLRLAFRERSQGDAQLSERLLFLSFPQRRPVAHCGGKRPICLRLQRSHQRFLSPKARRPAFAAHREAGSSALPPPTPPLHAPCPACSAPTSGTRGTAKNRSILNRERL